MLPCANITIHLSLCVIAMLLMAVARAAGGNIKVRKKESTLFSQDLAYAYYFF
jgi:hypothetical protein